MNNLAFDGKEYIRTLAEIVIAYSTFVGVLSAIIYYIADIKGSSIFIAHIITIFYIVVALMLVYWAITTINKGE